MARPFFLLCPCIRETGNREADFMQKGETLSHLFDKAVCCPLFDLNSPGSFFCLFVFWNGKFQNTIVICSIYVIRIHAIVKRESPAK